MASTTHSDETLNNIHVFMVSFPGQGHVNPLLRLGKRLAYSGLFITLSTPESVGSKIQEANNITDDEPVRFGRGMLRFEFFHDGWDINDLRRNNLDAYMAQLELVGRVKLPEMIRKHETGRPVSCLINNPFIPWVSDVAESLGIPSAMLWVQSCACFSAYYHFHHNLVPFPSENELEIDVKIPCMPVLRYDEIPSFLHPRSPYGFLGRAVLGQFKNLKKPFCILMDTFHELEHEIIEYMEELISTPIKTIGPLFKVEKSIGISNSIRVDFLPPENNCIQWLDSKPPQTVVYISFGSIVHLKQEQIDEIAYGLSSSEVSFLWVLRPPHAVPLGFLDEIGDKGKIVRWVPQEEVLAHASISCFVTHCGWNSTVEAVASGVPVAAFPQWGDQVTDAKFLVDVFRVGIRVSRGEDEGGIVSREEVERCLRAATGGKEAARMKENAVKWKKAAEVAVADSGSSCKNMQEFLDKVVRIGRKLN